MDFPTNGSGPATVNVPGRRCRQPQNSGSRIGGIAQSKTAMAMTGAINGRPTKREKQWLRLMVFQATWSPIRKNPDRWRNARKLVAFAIPSGPICTDVPCKIFAQNSWLVFPDGFFFPPPTRHNGIQGFDGSAQFTKFTRRMGFRCFNPSRDAADHWERLAHYAVTSPRHRFALLDTWPIPGSTLTRAIPIQTAIPSDHVLFEPASRRPRRTGCGQMQQVTGKLANCCHRPLFEARQDRQRSTYSGEFGQ